jgi:hypothetical protein
MVGKAQQIFDPSSKHPGNELTDYEDKYQHAYVFFAIIAMFLFFWLLVILGATNALH